MASDSEQASKRALEAFESIPGDSEAAVDYPPALKEEDLKPTEYFELSVEMIVRLPDGMTIEYRESVEKNDRFDYDFPEAAAIADQVNNVIQTRIG